MLINTKELFIPVSFKERPIYNEPLLTQGIYSTQPENYKNVINWIKRTPEAIGIINAIATDIISDGHEFIGTDESSSNKQKKARAEDFWKANRGREQLKAALFDWLCLGNGALWKGKISGTDMKEAFDKAFPPVGLDFKEFDFKQRIDEDLLKPKKLVHIPWSTVSIDINSDATGILRFRQSIPGKQDIYFSPEEVIHAKFMNFDGKVYGYTPMFASMSVISTLGLIKDHNGYFFENGGVPDWMFILPKEMAGSPNHKELVQVMQKYKETRHKHGNLVFTGEVEPQELNKFDKDMEFRQHAIYLTGVLALAFGMPVARIASIVGATVKMPAGSQDLSDAGYWRSISSSQDYWEDLLNTQLFEPDFRVHYKFKRGYKNDEIKEAQRDIQTLQVANDLLKMGAVTDEYVKEKLMIPDRFWTGKKLIPVESGFGGGFKPGQKGAPSDAETLPGEASKAKSVRKKAEQEKVNEQKEFERVEEVDIETFLRLFNYWVQNSETRRVLWKDVGMNYIMKIHTPDVVFKTTIAKSELSKVLGQLLFSRGIKVI